MPQPLPKFFGYMRSEGMEKFEKGFKNVGTDAPPRGQMIDQNHHGRDSRVELEGLDVVSDFFYGLMQQAKRFRACLPARQVRRWRLGLLGPLAERGHPLQKPPDPDDSLGRPLERLGKFSAEHLEKAHSVGAKFFNHFFGIDHVSPRLGHLSPILTQYQSHAAQSAHRLFE